MYVGFETLPHHANWIANAILRIDDKFEGKHIQDFAIFRQSYIARRVDGSPKVVTLDVARSGPKRNTTAAVEPSYMAACNANHGRLDGNVGNSLSFLHRAANGT